MTGAHGRWPVRLQEAEKPKTSLLLTTADKKGTKVNSNLHGVALLQGGVAGSGRVVGEHGDVGVRRAAHRVAAPHHLIHPPHHTHTCRLPVPGMFVSSSHLENVAEMNCLLCHVQALALAINARVQQYGHTPNASVQSIGATKILPWIGSCCTGE